MRLTGRQLAVIYIKMAVSSTQSRQELKLAITEVHGTLARLIGTSLTDMSISCSCTVLVEWGKFLLRNNLLASTILYCTVCI